MNNNIDNKSIGGGVIDFLKQGESYLYPITLTDAVYLSDGNLLSDKLNNLQTQINGKQPLGSYQPSGDYALTSHNHDSVYAKTSHTHNYLPLSGGTITDKLQLQKGFIISTNEDLPNTQGYFKVATIYIESMYQNRPITFILTDRGHVFQMILTVNFVNNSTTDPKLNTFSYLGVDYEAYIGKSNTSKWDIFVKKSEGYDNIAVDDVLGAYLNTGIIITYSRVAVTSLPNDCIRATPTNLSSINTNLYQYKNQAGQISAVQSGTPNTGMLWAW